MREEGGSGLVENKLATTWVYIGLARWTVQGSVVPVIDMSTKVMTLVTLHHDSSHLFNQRALQERGKTARRSAIPGEVTQ